MDETSPASQSDQISLFEMMNGFTDDELKCLALPEDF